MDFVRAGVGLGVSGVPLLMLDLAWFVWGIFMAIFLLFAIFGVLTVQRARTTIALTDNDITIMPTGRTLVWGELSELSLNFYATRGDHVDGWMQLALKSGTGRLKIDSRLEGFAAIATRARAAADANELTLSETTRANFATLASGRLLRPHGRGRG
ncbi:MAG: hypothetical protein AAF493_06730 [Pseudomonadota bacterium]